MNNLSFTVWKDPESQLLPQTYYFDVDKNGNPIKLGDGSFGIVFRVRNIENDPTKGGFAVKIFHSDETMQDRFKVELEFYDEIKRVAEANKIPESELTCIVKPLGGTSTFHESAAYKNLFKKNGLNLKISSYAIVMDRYDNTLKDLLENKENEELSGYEILQKIRINERIKYVLPFIKDCISGLRTLYIVKGNAHLDLKPANLFYKKDRDTFTMAIADMGCLRPIYHDPGNDKTMPLNEDTRRKQLLGTINYRSPEQKDYQEICNGKVQRSPEGAIEILVQDPKFYNSIIEEGDLVFFSKSNDPVPYVISKFERSEITGQEYTRITLQEDERSAKIVDDDRTQIVIHKLQQIRTDLFGIGAITYDLITCGKSPERFYERLRIWDDQHNSIDKIMERYRRLVNDNFSEPQSKHVFESLYWNGRYAPEKIVRFILRCMLYHSPGSYYNSIPINSQDYAESILIVSAQDYPVFTREQMILSQLQHDFKHEIEGDAELGPEKRTDNPLMTKKIPKITSSPDEFLNIAHVLKSLQQCSNEKNGSRLMLAYHYTDLLFEFTNKLFEDDRSLFFAEFNPENLSKGRSEKNGRDKLSQPKYVAFPRKEDYYDALKDYELHIKIKTEPNSFFIPLELVHIHRPIVLFAPEGNLPDPEADNIFSFHFSYRSYPYDEVKPGDWILLRKKESAANELYQITWVNNDANLLCISFFDTQKQKLDKSKKISYDMFWEVEKDELIYYKNIDRGAYYLQVLGVYIHQLFFLGLNDANEVSIPAFIDMVNIQSSSHAEMKFTCLSTEKILNKYDKMKPNPIQREITFIYIELVSIYARLVLSCIDNSFYRPSDNEVRRNMPYIRESLERIRKKMEDTLNLDRDSLRTNSKFLEYVDEYIFHGKHILENQTSQAMIEKADRLVQDNFPANFNFEDILNKLIVPEKKSNDLTASFFDNLKTVFNNKTATYLSVAVIAIVLSVFGFLNRPSYEEPKELVSAPAIVPDTVLDSNDIQDTIVEPDPAISENNNVPINSGGILDSLKDREKYYEDLIKRTKDSIETYFTQLDKLPLTKTEAEELKIEIDRLDSEIRDLEGRNKPRRLADKKESRREKRNQLTPYYNVVQANGNKMQMKEKLRDRIKSYKDSLDVISKQIKNIEQSSSKSI